MCQFENFENLKMMKRFYTLFLFYYIVLCIVFLSLLYSMIYSKFNNISPNFTIGFPFEMYYQFEVRGKCNERTLLHGTHFINILYNMVICFVLSVIINKNKLTLLTPSRNSPFGG